MCVAKAPPAPPAVPAPPAPPEPAKEAVLSQIGSENKQMRARGLAGTRLTGPLGASGQAYTQSLGKTMLGQ